jgi:hypothetical protein
MKRNRFRFRFFFFETLGGRRRRFEPVAVEAVASDVLIVEDVPGLDRRRLLLEPDEAVAFCFALN